MTIFKDNANIGQQDETPATPRPAIYNNNFSALKPKESIPHSDIGSCHTANCTTEKSLSK